VPASWDDSRLAFDEAGSWFVETVAQVGDRWSDAGLGEWDVRALVGHTSRSFVTVETYLAKRAEAVEVPSAVEYYRITSELAAGPGVAERGREAGRVLGDDPVAAVADLRTRVVGLLAEKDGSEVLTTIAGGMRLADYLPTRVFELVVHTLDLARALGLPMDVPARPAAQVLELVSELAVVQGKVGSLVLAVTGRGGLPSGFSVL
jgi:uncharacterized protein (TIGR03083 family)